ncbi:MAG: insulinase family protein [Pseudomonadota bacterium]|nr:insulinase family protein [Pseudomonadota bacterium]
MKLKMFSAAVLLAGTAGVAALAQGQVVVRSMPSGRAPSELAPGPSGSVVQPAPAQPGAGPVELRPDPAARLGELPNGMRYVIYPNATPPGQASVRLHFRAGDLMERDEQNGLAHFIEHMVLNETRNYPEGELLRTLERQGMAFGREVNAFTAPDQTVYVLDVPTVNETKLDTVLNVLREVAGEATFSPAAIDRERGIIQSEDRSMYPPARRGFVASQQFLARDQLISRRLDIGNLDVIRTAPRERFVDFYQRYYRPERATLVVAGDVDPAAVEAKIRARFSGWRGVGPAGANPDLGRLATRGFESGSFVREGAIREVSVSWLRPYREVPDSLAKRREEWRKRLTLAVLNRRLQRLAEADDAPFTQPAAFVGDLYESLERTSVRVEPKPGKYAEAAAILEREVRRMAEHGVLETELQREITETRSRLEAAVAGARTRPTAVLASQIVQTVNEKEVLLSPEQQLAVFVHSTQGFDAPAAGAVARMLFAGSGPLLFATSPDPIQGGHQRLAEAFQASTRTRVEAPVAMAAREWPYGTFGAPGQVVERQEIADLGVTRVRFANGVNLLVKPTKFARDQVMVTARIGGGRFGFAPGPLTALMDQGGFVASGLGRLSQEEIREALAGRVYSSSFFTLDNAFQLRGTTRPADLTQQLQLLTAYVVDPGWRQQAFERKKTEFQNILNLISTAPLQTAMTQFPRLARSGDARWGLPTRDQLASADLASVRSAIEPALRSGPIEIVMVGDVTVERAIQEVASTFGALPQRQAQPRFDPRLTRAAFPLANGAVTRLQHSGRPDVAMGMIAWATDDYYDDPAEARALQVLESILRLRTIDKLREELGATYSPVVLRENSETLDEFGLIAMGAEVNPSQLGRLMEVIEEVAQGLKAGEVQADELARAREPMLQALSREQAGNEFWAGRLAGSTWDPRRLDSIRTQEQLVRAVNAADIRRIAQKYLERRRSFRLVVEPAATAPTAVTPS